MWTIRDLQEEANGMLRSSNQKTLTATTSVIRVMSHRFLSTLGASKLDTKAPYEHHFHIH